MPQPTSSSFFFIAIVILRSSVSQPVLPIPGAQPGLPIAGAPLGLPLPGAQPGFPLPGAQPGFPLPGAQPGLPFPTSQPGLPFLPSLLGSPCNGTQCGRGSCVPSLNSSVGFVCECELGWRQARPDTDQFLKFLPCIIPNCTINYSCSDEGRTTDFDTVPDLPSIRTCTYDNCGNGICNQTSSITHACICKDGYYNLMNDTTFPCYKQCSFGPECPGLRFNSTTSLPMPNSIIDFNHGLRLNSAAGSIIAVVTLGARLVWAYA